MLQEMNEILMIPREGLQLLIYVGYGNYRKKKLAAFL